MCRGKSNQYPSTSLIQIEGVNTTEEVNWYLGKRIAYVYKAKTKKNGTLYRATWGRVVKPHGNSGVVRARFKTNLPPSSLASVSISLYNAFVGISLYVCFKDCIVDCCTGSFVHWLMDCILYWLLICRAHCT